MKKSFSHERDGIYRLKIPFEAVYTSVFLIETEEKTILVDCATTANDVDEYVIPSLSLLGYKPTEVDMIVLTHLHGDHAGGLGRLLEYAPHIEVITCERNLTNGISTYALPGHTLDCIGVFDARTGTLISGDALQGAGVGIYRCIPDDKSAYLKTIEKVKNDTRIQNILFSHAYEPWYQDAISGRENVCDCLRKCIEYV